MRTTTLAIIIVFGVLLAVAAVIFGLHPPGAGPMTQEDLNSMRMNPPDDYFDRLTAVIEGPSDPYVRERAVFTLTDIAITRDETDQVTAFLKDLILEGDDSNMVSAAYANIGLIRTVRPPEKTGRMELSVEDDIVKGGTVTLVATLSTTVDTVKVVTGPSSLPENIWPLSDPLNVTVLYAGHPQDVTFDLQLNETGSYLVPVSCLMSFDAVDYEMIESAVLLTVGDSSGEYLVIPG